MPEIKDIITDVLGEATDGIWDGPKDTEFLKEVGKELAELRAKKLAGSPVPEVEIDLVEEALLQRAAQKALKVNDFKRVFRVARKLATLL